MRRFETAAEDIEPLGKFAFKFLKEVVTWQDPTSLTRLASFRRSHQPAHSSRVHGRFPGNCVLMRPASRAAPARTKSTADAERTCAGTEGETFHFAAQDLADRSQFLAPGSGS